MKRHATQREDVLEYLRKNGSITQMEAYRVFDAPITRLSAVVFDLRKLGHNIISTDLNGKNCYGSYQCTRYELEE